ncbi:TniB family NTP-binding protein [Variovorax sp. dw_954]|uniref:TniB family NTP-binding protein n=1 Tax=Variovorax sp. dw_954 TaxID=2720078 RepID=UPI001BD242FF|nr:TniB family NTP-binding protein [Variovorax sp. dw_954]
MSKTIFEGWIFDHIQYQNAFDTMVEEIERVLDGGSPIFFPLLGDSRAGKTAMLKDLEAHFADRVSPSGLRQVMLVSMPSTASNEALAIRIITAVFGNIPVKGKSHQIIDQARRTMEAAGVLVLLIDETNHLVEKRSTERAQTKENRHAADWFKELGDLAGISVVMAGLSHVIRMYTDNDQLENRGLVGARIEPYAWSVGKDRQQFQNMMSAGITHMKEHGWQIEVDNDWLTRLAYLGGGGYIGKARDFLVRIEEVGNKRKCLDRELLSRAYKGKYRLDSKGDPLDQKTIDDVQLNGAHREALARALRSGRGPQK